MNYVFYVYVIWAQHIINSIFIASEGAGTLESLSSRSFLTLSSGPAIRILFPEISISEHFI